MISIYNSVSKAGSGSTGIINYAKTITIEGEGGYDNSPTKPYTITAVLDELPALSYNTSWDLSPLARVDSFVKEKSSKELINAVASLTPNTHYDTPVATDAWTQLFPKDGSTVKFDVKFTAFYKYMLNTSSYFKIINKIYNGLPPVAHSLTAYGDIIATGIDTAETLGAGYVSMKGKTGLDGVKDDFMGENNIFKGIAALVEAAFSDKTIEENAATIKEQLTQAKNALLSFFTNIERSVTGSHNSGGPDKYRITIPYVINNRKTESTKLEPPWFFYITNFSFSPSINTVNHSIKTAKGTITHEVPISVDFNITFESDRVLTNADLLAAII